MHSRLKEGPKSLGKYQNNENIAHLINYKLKNLQKKKFLRLFFVSYERIWIFEENYSLV